MLKSFTRYFESFLTAIEHLGLTLSIYAQYEPFVGHNPAFRKSITTAYNGVVAFLERCKTLFHKKGLRLFISSIWRDFESEHRHLLYRINQDLVVLQHQTTFAFRQDLMCQTCMQREESSKIYKSVEGLKIRAREEDLRGFLNPAPFEANYLRQLNKRYEESGKWLFNAPTFRAWLASNADLLWIQGHPGCGKSVLSSVVIEYLQSTACESEHIAYHHFDFADPQNNTALCTFSTLLYQLRNVPGEPLRNYLNVIPHVQTSGRQLISVIESMRSLELITQPQGSCITVILDGLDESEESSRIATFLIGLMQNSPSLRVLILSRKIYELSTVLANHSTMTLCKISTKQDIDTFLERKIRALNIESSIRDTEQIIANVQEKADGSFLWASTMVDRLKSAISLADIEELLHSSDGIRGLCRKSLLQLTGRPQQQQELARRAIYWICCAKTPLTTIQLQSATAFSPKRDRFELTRKPFVWMLEDLTSTLFKIDTRDHLVRPLHASVKDFLTNMEYARQEQNPAVSSFLVNIPSRNLDIALECLALVRTFLDNGRLCCSPGKEPLFHYCAVFWFDHLLASPPNEAAAEIVISFLDSDCRHQWITYYLVKQRQIFPLNQLLRVRAQLCKWLGATKLNGRQTCLEWDYDVASALVRLYETNELLHNAGIGSESGLRWSIEETLSHFELMMVVRDLARYLTQNKTLPEGIDFFESVFMANSNAQRNIKDNNIWIMNTLGILYDQAGQVDLATATQERVLDTLLLISKSNPTISDQLIWTSNELGRMYRHRGYYKLAETMHLKALTALEAGRTEGANNDRVILEIAWTNSTLARVYRAQHSYSLAQKYSSAAYETRSKFLGPKHPHTLWVLSDIAQIHFDQQIFGKAVELHTEILAGRIETLGDEHPDTLWTMNNLGVALAMLGTNEALIQARELQVQALQGQERVLGPKHPHAEWTRKKLITSY